MTFIATKLFHKAGEGSGGGGGDQHNLGWYATESALTTAHPTATAGDWAIVGSTDTVWVWDSDTTAWVDSDTKGQVTSVNGQTGAVTVDALPSQTGHSGEFLTTDGTDASWSDKPLVNTATPTNSLSILGTNTTSDNTITIGKNCNVYGTQGNSVVIGNSISVNYVPEGVGIGNQCTPYNYSVCVGKGSGGAGSYAVSLGWGAKVNGTHAIQIGNTGSTTTNSDANTMKVANANGNFEMMSADGTVPSDRLVHAINKYSTMPTAASTNEGWIVQFTGTTDATYTHGHLYECVSDGQTPATYSWTEVQLGSGSSLPSQTGQSGKFLTTDGTSPSWSDKPLVNTSTATNSLTILGNATSGTTYTNRINIGVGSFARYADCMAIGANAKSEGDYSIAIGRDAYVSSGSGYHCVVLGNYSSARARRCIALGTYAVSSADYAIAIGGGSAAAKAAQATAIGSIQLGSSSTDNGAKNSDANTFKVANANGNYEMMSADGTIPAARHAALPAADGTYTLQLVITNGVPTLSWVAV